MAIMVQQQPNNLKQEITFEKNGFIGIFDNVFEDEYIDELINFFEAKDKMNFVQKLRKILLHTYTIDLMA